VHIHACIYIERGRDHESEERVKREGETLRERRERKRVCVFVFVCGGVGGWKLGLFATSQNMISKKHEKN